MLTQEHLSAALFPLGGMTKLEVRRLAAKMGLPVARKAESQEICFVTSGEYAEFVRGRMPWAFRPGPIVDTSGRVIGTHRGLPYYTVGQRRGLGIAAGRPMYVVEIDAERNTIVVGEAEETSSKGLVASSVNLIPFDELTSPMRVTCKIRYRADEAPAVLEPLAQREATRAVKVTFDRPQRAVTPGQSAVFYDGEVVVGGGVIEHNDWRPLE